MKFRQPIAKSIITPNIRSQSLLLGSRASAIRSVLWVEATNQTAEKLVRDFDFPFVVPEGDSALNRSNQDSDWKASS